MRIALAAGIGFVAWLVTGSATHSAVLAIAAGLTAGALSLVAGAVITRGPVVSSATALFALGVGAAAGLTTRTLAVAIAASVLCAPLPLAAWWAFWPEHHLPHNRERRLAIRLHLRLYAGRGLGTAWEVWHRWGRLASWRESKRTRRSLTRWQRLNSQAHAVYIGRVQYTLRIWVTIQEHVAIIGPPRFFKTALLARAIMAAPGPAVCTSSKPDLYNLTSGVRRLQIRTGLLLRVPFLRARLIRRAAHGGPIYRFNPQGIGGARCRNNVFWNPLSGCEDPSTAIRRADQLTAAVSVAGAEDASFWSGKASDGMRAILAAAAMARGADMRTVEMGAGSERQVGQAVQILARAGHEGWADQLAELTGPAEKTAATVRMVMSRALAFLKDPVLAAAVTPRPGQEFDIDKFLREGGTLYMMSRGASAEMLAPLFAALAAEIQYRAVELGSQMDGGRLDPPLLMALDEVTQICPVPLPQWLADAGGQGVQVWVAFHGVAQLMARYGPNGAQSILDTTNVHIFMPGLKNPVTLETAVKLAGTVSFRLRGQDENFQWFERMTASMIRCMPKGFALIIRDNCAPLICRVARGWEHPVYKFLNRRDQATAPVEAPAEVATGAVEAVTAGAGARLAITPPSRHPDPLYPWNAPPDGGRKVLVGTGYVQPPADDSEGDS
jgi:type IV secretion system protein VirD4